MNALRTAEQRFSNLPGYHFEPNYVEIGGLRMHYVDAGPADAAPILLLHGEPSWSYLYRKMIPPLASAGHRVIAPDLIGFGRSDKPAAQSDYSYAIHVDWMRQFIEALGNGGMPTGDEEFPRAFRIWRAFARWSPWFPVGRIIQSGTVTELTKDEVAAYDAPYPSARYKAGARAFPTLVPTESDDVASDDNRRAWELLPRFEKPFLTTFSNRDPITRGGERPFQERVPGAKNQPHVRIKNAGHFLQEDKGEELAAVLISFIEST